MKKAVFMLAAVSFVAIHAETRLSGEIQSASLEASGSPYFIEKDITVPAGKKLTIKDGCVFLFSGFTGLNVSGDLSVEGTTQQPVIFTCVNDNEFNPKTQQIANPFDWNGIIITKESGSVHFQNFQLRYSVYGIKSQNSAMTIQNGLFRQNGQFHFTINDKIQYVQDNISYSYNASGESNKKPDTATGTQQKNTSTRNLVRYISLGTGVVGIVGGTIFALQALSTKNKMEEKNRNPNTDLITGPKEYSDLQNELKTRNALTAVFFTLGGLGLVGFTATFVF